MLPPVDAAELAKAVSVGAVPQRAASSSTSGRRWAILAFLAGQAAHFLHGAPHPYASAVAYLAMIVWAYEELTHGVNLFRNLLGLGYAISTLVHLAVALHR